MSALVPLSVDLTEQVRHFLLDSQIGWRALVLDRLEESPCADGLRLAAEPSNGRTLVDQAGTLGGLVAPTGVGVDAIGRIYLIDREDDTVRRFDPCCASFDRLPCVGGVGDEPRRLSDPHGLAVSKDGYVYIADTGNRRVQVFSPKGLALLGVWGPIDGNGRPAAASPAPAADPAMCPPGRTFPTGTWEPWGVALDRNGGAYVTDRANGLVHKFDRFGCWRWARDGSAADNPALANPTHIAIDRCGRLYVVQDGLPDVVIFDRDATYLGRAEPAERLRDRFRPGPLVASPDGDLYVVDQATPRLQVYCCPDVPGRAVSFVSGACDLPEPGGGIAFDANGDALVTLPGSGQVIHLEGDRAFATWGRYFSLGLDSHRRMCQWHRVVLRGNLPVGAAVTVHTATSEVTWEDSEVLSLPEDSWAGGQTWSGSAIGDWDCMVMSPPARYLWLRLTVTGPASESPLLEAVKVYYPRISSADKLPAVFRAGPDATDFVGRFMSVFDSIAHRIDHVLDDFGAYLEPGATPASPAPPSPSGGIASGTDFLTWLASWLGLVFDGTWSEATRRRLLADAAWLYARRGTIPGLMRALRSVMGLDGEADDVPIPGVLEQFKLRRWALLDSRALGDETMLWGRRIVDRLQIGDNSTIGSFRITDVGDPVRDPFFVYAHRFNVFFPAACARTENNRRAVERMIELTKPAHTVHELKFVEPRLRIGVQATIGLDTAIGRYPDSTQADVALLGRDSVLGDRPGDSVGPTFKVGVHSLIGSAVL